MTHRLNTAPSKADPKLKSGSQLQTNRFALSGFKRLHSKLLVAALSVFAFGSAAQAKLEPYTAVYSFDIDGKYTGEATRQLSEEKPGVWKYQFFSSIPIVGSAAQVALVQESGNQLIPLANSTRYKILFHKRETTLKFDRTANKLQVNDRGEKRSYPLQAGSYDDLSVELKIREDLKKGALKSSYLLADEDGIEPMNLINLGKETIKVPAGEFEVIKLQKKHSNPKRKTYFWLAPKLDYMPVRVMQDDKGAIYDTQLKTLKNG